MLGHLTQLRAQVRRIAEPEMQAVDSVSDELGHPTGVRGDDRNARDEGFLDRERGVLVPDTRHDDDVEPRQDLADPFVFVRAVKNDVRGRSVFDSSPELLGDRTAEDRAEDVQARPVVDLSKGLEKQLHALLWMQSPDVSETDTRVVGLADTGEVPEPVPQKLQLVARKPAARMTLQQKLARRQEAIDIANDAPGVGQKEFALVLEVGAPWIAQPSGRPISGDKEQGSERRARVLPGIALPAGDRGQPCAPRWRGRATARPDQDRTAILKEVGVLLAAQDPIVAQQQGVGADQTVVVKCVDDHRATHTGQGDEIVAQAQEIVEMDDVGTNVVEDRPETPTKEMVRPVGQPGVLGEPSCRYARISGGVFPSLP